MCNYNGYVEGWAVYAENLSYGLIDFGEDSSIITRLYQINHILNLAIPARIDLGVHYEGWNRNKTNQFYPRSVWKKKKSGRRFLTRFFPNRRTIFLTTLATSKLMV